MLSALTGCPQNCPVAGKTRFSPALYQHRPCNQLLASQTNKGLTQPTPLGLFLCASPGNPTLPPATYPPPTPHFSKRNKNYTPPSTVSFSSSFPSHLHLRPPLSSKHLQLSHCTFLKIAPSRLNPPCSTLYKASQSDLHALCTPHHYSFSKLSPCLRAQSWTLTAPVLCLERTPFFYRIPGANPNSGFGEHGHILRTVCSECCIRIAVSFGAPGDAVG